MNAGRVSPSVALAAYAEAWISGAKVVVYGDASSPLARRLVERGARHVQVYDANASRSAEAAAAETLQQIAFAPFDLAGGASRDGLFDVGIVEDLTAFGVDPKQLLATLGRSLSRRGLGLVCSRNPDAPARLLGARPRGEAPPGYYDLYDSVSQHFEEVRMLGQAPFVGYAIADFGAGDASDVRLDTGLLPSGAEEPEWFLALASELPVSPDPFAVIQLPLSEVGLASARPERGGGRAADVGRAERRIAELEAQLAKLSADRPREPARRDDKQHQQRIAALEAELKKRDDWALGLESRAATADQRADEAQAELDQLTRAVERAKREAARAEQLLDEERRAKQKLEDGARAQEQELERRERRLVSESARASELAVEIKRLSAKLAELSQADIEQKAVAKRTSELSLALAESEQKAKQLAGRVDESSRALAESEQKAKQLAGRVDESSRALAESEQKAKQLAGRVDELSRALVESDRRAREASEAADAELRVELEELEARFAERAGEVARLTRALHDTERFGRGLIAKLSELEEARETPAEPADAQPLKQRIAELSADLEAARWTISSLEANVGPAHTGPTLPSTPSMTPDEAAAERREDGSPDPQPAAHAD